MSSTARKTPRTSNITHAHLDGGITLATFADLVAAGAPDAYVVAHPSWNGGSRLAHFATLASAQAFIRSGCSNTTLIGR
jgi:hypothetical protein